MPCVRGFEATTSIKIATPTPAIPVTVHAFYNPRGSEGPKATTVTRIATSTLAILAIVDIFQTPRPFEGLAVTTDLVNYSIGNASRDSIVTTLEFVDTVGYCQLQRRPALNFLESPYVWCKMQHSELCKERRRCELQHLERSVICGAAAWPCK